MKRKNVACWLLKKCLPIIVALLLALSMAACGSEVAEETVGAALSANQAALAAKPGSTGVIVTEFGVLEDIPYVAWATRPEAKPTQNEPAQTETEAPGNMVWIPTKVGVKYHTNPDCGGMIDPDYVSITEAQERGFTACENCY